MLGKVPASRLRLIEEIVRTARGRAPVAERGLAETFLRRYFHGVANDDLSVRGPAALAGAALCHLADGARRRPGQSLVRVFNPDQQSDGFTSPHTAVTIVCDDMPFLVDSIGMATNQAGLAVHLIVHPVIDVKRDGRGRLRGIVAPGTPGSRLESWQFVEVDRETDPGRLAALQARLEAVLDDVAVAVADWAEMRRRAQDLAANLEAEPLPLSSTEILEGRALLEWMADNHFTFLGTRYYRLVRGRSSDRLVPDRQSGLGLLRPNRAGHPVHPATLTGEVRAHARDRELLVITKANTVATVHRATYLDYVGVKSFNARGEVDGEHRFLGLWTSTAYSRSPRDIPVLRHKVQRIIAHFGLAPQSHDGKAVLHVLDTYPRDELFQASTEDLIPIVRGIVNLYDRQQVRLFVRRDGYHRFWSCLLYVPRDRYSTEVRQRIETLVRAGYGATAVESSVQLSESVLARVHLILRTPDGRRVPDPVAIERQIAAAVLTWQDGLRAALTARHDEAEALKLLARYGRALPIAYQEDTPPAAAVSDIAALEALASAPQQLHLRFYRPAGAAANRVNLKLYQVGEPRAISDVLPTLENLGLRLISERPYEVTGPDQAPRWVQDFELELVAGPGLDLALDGGRLTEAITALWQGRAENDGFNRLVLGARLSWRETAVLRAYCRWLLQTGISFSQPYMESVLAANARTAERLARLFIVRFDPALTAKRRQSQAARLGRELDNDLAAVARLDEDRILRAFRAAIDATLRTNYFQARAGSTEPKSYLSFKIDPSRVPGLPEPRPMFEIWMYAPRVEGVHLRKGRVARGGLRWSDRYEDFRTEVLGLMKAQNVKNTVIVPVGAKGGFVCRRLPAGREAAQQELVACYQDFVRGLLDLTDNIVDGATVPPAATVRCDKGDPYLVVAADKGTATFSDIANAISADYRFWLGDAFASGGSAGYDHKKIAITSRGAWECVKRHFRELGTDTQSQDFTVAGIGDMSGDVFGNGLLRSNHARLLAAFNHQHIFIDPAPNAARSFRERQRLFNLPRSTWADYGRRELSPGGGIWSRADKSIKLTREARALLGITADAVPPNEVIKAILRLKVDLLWNGGIGTYVKATSETHGAVGDRANDGVRIDGRELRCRVVGEGGNLGFSQLGRIEYALAGGRINTDFIDNSGGVNCSDLEVNIKILLRLAEERRGLRRPARDRLLARMTDEIAALVLRNNYLQSQALSTLEARALERANEHAHAIRALERGGDLDRALEYLPDDAALEERVLQGKGLTRPELAILLSYSKIWLYHQIIESDLPEDPYLANELERYFPSAILARYQDLLRLHPLRREIIATATTNSLTNRMGPVFAMRVAEDTGASMSAITRAYAIARESTAMRDLWRDIEALDNRVPAAVQYDMHYATARSLRYATYWVLAHRARALEVESAVAELRPGLAELIAAGPPLVVGRLGEQIEAQRTRYLKAGVPHAIAARIAALELLQSGLYIVELAARRRTPLLAVARTYLHLGHALDLDGLRLQIDALPADGHWQAVARGSLRDNLYALHSSLTDSILRGKRRGDPARTVDVWLAARPGPVGHLKRILADMASAPRVDFPTLSVAMQALARLAGD
ncbi:MAG TPA: NAD-glutamate dehydrogenase [Steroidobacteraceae bacterium]|nr:NAD-glutamate dehydrogenase [Steroidobacteraceae bacterium]